MASTTAKRCHSLGARNRALDRYVQHAQFASSLCIQSPTVPSAPFPHFRPPSAVSCSGSARLRGLIEFPSPSNWRLSFISLSNREFGSGLSRRVSPKLRRSGSFHSRAGKTRQEFSRRFRLLGSVFRSRISCLPSRQGSRTRPVTARVVKLFGVAFYNDDRPPRPPALCARARVCVTIFSILFSSAWPITARPPVFARPRGLYVFLNFVLVKFPFLEDVPCSHASAECARLCSTKE